MGILDLLRRRSVRRERDRVWSNASARLEGVWREARSASERGAVLLLAHFPSLLEELHTAPGAIPHERLSSESAVARFLAARTPHGVAVAQASDLAPAPHDDHPHEPPLFVLVAERHPLRSRDELVEKSLATYPGRDVLRFHLALDDPLLRRFVGDAVAPLLERLGLTEGEPIESPMLDRAVARAQRQIAARARADLEAASSEGWLETNLPR